MNKLKIIFKIVCFLLQCFFCVTITNSQWVGISDLDGRCFAQIPEGVNNDIFFGCSFGGIFKSFDNGNTWIHVFAEGNTTRCMSVNGNRIFAGTSYYGLFRSTDYGANWDMINNGINYLPSMNAVISSSNNTFAGNTVGVYYSSNYGVNWTTVNNGLQSLYITSFAILGNYVLVGTTEGICISSNNGTTWLPINNGLTNTYVHCVAVNGNKIFAGTSGGVFLSTNNGSTWIAKNNGLTSLVSISFTFINNFTFTTINYGGVFFTSNDGDNWTPKNEGLTIDGNFYPLSLMIANNYIFLGESTGTVGVYRRPLSEITGIQPINNNIPIKFSLSQNYPNPFNPSTTINYQLPKASDVKLIVYDVMGRAVKSLVNEKENAGSYQVQFDGSNVSSGVYFYKLQTGDFIETKKMSLIK